MARTTNEADFNEKRKLIIQTAMKYIYSVGFEEMSIQNLLDDLNISKGAFYHYFPSKEDLLLGLIDELGEGIYKQINPIVDDPTMNGLEKMNAYFEKAGIVKLEKAEYLVPITKAWYDEKNIVVREKLMRKSYGLIAPILTRFIKQGISEGIFSNPYPERIGEVIYQIFLDMGDSIASELINIGEEGINSDRFIETIDIYTHIFEQILHAPKGSIVFISRDLLQTWINLFQQGLNYSSPSKFLEKE